MITIKQVTSTAMSKNLSSYNFGDFVKDAETKSTNHILSILSDVEIDYFYWKETFFNVCGRFFAHRKNLGRFYIDKLIKHRVGLRELLHNPKCDEGLLNKIYHNEGKLYVLGYKGKIPAWMIEKNIKSENEDIKRVLAQRRDLTPEQYMTLSKSRFLSTKLAIVENSSTPHEVLLRLSKLKNYRVISSLARSDNLSLQLVKNLMRSDHHITILLCENKNITQEMADFILSYEFYERNRDVAKYVLSKRGFKC